MRRALGSEGGTMGRTPNQPGDRRENGASDALKQGAQKFADGLGATPHVWALIGLVYAYLALFGLVVVLAVIGR
jgi:hypothetical protein